MRHMTIREHMTRNPRRDDCSICGDTVPASGWPGNRSMAADVTATVCPRCTMMKADVHEVPTAVRRCPDCGDVLQKAARFCPKCSRTRRLAANRAAVSRSREIAARKLLETQGLA